MHFDFMSFHMEKTCYSAGTVYLSSAIQYVLGVFFIFMSSWDLSVPKLPMEAELLQASKLEILESGSSSMNMGSAIS